jgi:archaellum component FlaC
MFNSFGKEGNGMTQTNGHQQPDRLDRLEALMASQLEFNRQIQQQAAATDERMTRIETGMTELQRSMSGMTQALSAMAQTQIQILQRIDETQQEVKGLQTENRRILDYLFHQD